MATWRAARTETNEARILKAIFRRGCGQLRRCGCPEACWLSYQTLYTSSFEPQIMLVQPPRPRYRGRWITQPTGQPIATLAFSVRELHHRRHGIGQPAQSVGVSVCKGRATNEVRRWPKTVKWVLRRHVPKQNTQRVCQGQCVFMRNGALGEWLGSPAPGGTEDRTKR